MRIGMMADVYDTHVSGVTNSIALTKRWLENMGHEVYIFTFGDDNAIDMEKNIIHTTGVPLADTGIYFNVRYCRAAVRMLRSMDIAHAHHPFVSGSLAMRYCVPRNIPVVFTNHSRYDLMAQAYLPILPEPLGDAALKAYLSPFFRACDLVVVPSASMLPILEEHFGLDVPAEVIPNGLDLSAYREITHPMDRSAFGFSNTEIILVYIGRLAPEKNLTMLLKAFYGAASTYDCLRLLIVGDGPDRESLEHMVKEMNLEAKVHFAGMVDYENIPCYLAAADIFVTPSSSETFGLSTAEAMAAGLPVIGIDAPGTVDIIEDGITGLISSDDVAVLTAKIIFLSTEHEQRKKMGQQARIASQKFDIENTTHTLLRHYQRLLENAKHRPKKSVVKMPQFFEKLQ